jgi:hypothetical protein
MPTLRQKVLISYVGATEADILTSSSYAEALKRMDEAQERRRLVNEEPERFRFQLLGDVSASSATAGPNDTPCPSMSSQGESPVVSQ